MRAGILLLIVILFSSTALPDTIHVPADYSTIQAAIDASANGDEVLVAPGTYMENIDFLSKAIALKSTCGAKVTIIDGNKCGSVVTFRNGEDVNTIINGFTIINGTGTAGSHIFGGGIYCRESSPVISNNTITQNEAQAGGGGIFCYKSAHPVIINNLISSNIAGIDSGDGGGIFCRSNSSPHIISNMIFNNSAYATGGGIRLDESSPELTNNTITGNLAGKGGGIYCNTNSYTVITNSIFWNNSSTDGKEMYIGNTSNPSTISISYSNVEGGLSSINILPGCTLTCGDGMIDADPLFYDPADNDFHLKQDPCQPGIVNPCVDTGDPDSSMIEGTTRTDGVQDNGIVDMGFHYPSYEGDILHVPSEYQTIQEAIDSSQNGDTVLVATGTYVENIDFKGKAIVVKSKQGSHVTVIDGNQSGSVVLFQSGEGPYSVLEGFTLKNGSGKLSGGQTRGGGIYCDNSSPTIHSNTISGNMVSYLGGGICCFYNSSPTVTNNTILQNSAGFGGGGIYCYEYSSPTITNNTISENSVGSNGGGIFCRHDSSPTITNNTISGNSAVYYGGGIHLNTDSSPIISNNTISGNSTDEGGGICCYGSSPVITNNTILGNQATLGGGVSCMEGSFITITNTIIWDNNAVVGPEISIGSENITSTLTVSNSDVEGGQSSVYIDPGCTLNWGSGMIYVDPLFVDSPNSDLHLTWLSPCRDTGDNTAVTEPTDFEGDPRIAYGIVDMGADEFYTHLYVTGDKTPGGSIQGKFVGLPGTTPVGLFIGTGVLPTPIPTMWGEYWLQAPWVLLGPLGTIPSNGVMVLPATLPPGMTVPVDIPMQALIGLNADSLTNLEVLEVR